MKQYAAHRVYLAGTEEWCNGPQVVSVSEGKAVSYTHLTLPTTSRV